MRVLSLKSLLLVVLSFLVLYFLLLQFHQFKVDRQALIYNELHFNDKYYFSDAENPASLIAGLEDWALEESKSLDDYWINPHLFRYLMIRPFTLLSGASNLNVDLIFSVAAVCYLIISSLVTFCLLPSTKRNLASLLAVFCLFYVVSFFMNGRLIHAFIAAPILLFAITHFYKLPFMSVLGLVVCGLFFATVSSGVFFFLFNYLILSCCMLIYQRLEIKKSIILLGVVVALSSSYLVSILHKLVEYYNGDFFEGVFLHGAGRLINLIPFSVGMLAGGCTLFLTFFLWKKREIIWRWIANNYPSFFMLMVGFGGCIVGFGAIAIAIPAFCILCIPLILPRSCSE